MDATIIGVEHRENFANIAIREINQICCSGKRAADIKQLILPHGLSIHVLDLRRTPTHKLMLWSEVIEQVFNQYPARRGEMSNALWIIACQSHQRPLPDLREYRIDFGETRPELRSSLLPERPPDLAPLIPFLLLLFV